MRIFPCDLGFPIKKRKYIRSRFHICNSNSRQKVNFKYKNIRIRSCNNININKNRPRFDKNKSYRIPHLPPVTSHMASIGDESEGTRPVSLSTAGVPANRSTRENSLWSHRNGSRVNSEPGMGQFIGRLNWKKKRIFIYKHTLNTGFG